MKIKEKNVQEFNKDIVTHGQYVYTDTQRYSSLIATKRQTDEIHNLLLKCFKKPIVLLDIGCGDGTYTFDFLRLKNVKKIEGFDVAKKAVLAAKRKINKNQRKKIHFTVGDIYSMKRSFSHFYFDVGIVRGVLHHLYQPKRAIKQLSFLPFIIVLEPNGYNPILKLIERISPYHRAHEEKSYFPPLLNAWFEENGYQIVAQKFFGIVPYFFPTNASKILKFFEPFLERIPFVHVLYAGTNVVLYQKQG